MRFLIVFATVVVGKSDFDCCHNFKLFLGVLSQTTEEPKPKCEGFTCPNNDPEGGLFPYGDGCNEYFCDCNYGIID